MQPGNIFAGPYLDRAAHLRQDAAWFAAALANPRSRVLPIWNNRNLIVEEETPHAGLLELSQIPPERRTADDLILLGMLGDEPMFVYEIDAVDPPAILANARFEDLRMVAAALEQTQAGLLSYARALVFWRRNNRFCGNCGVKTEPTKAGHVLLCTNPTCRHEHFPRTDPAIIVLITDGERALLGRQASWPAGRYSTIAGFVEPGESLEDAVAREVREETGVEVGDIDYHSSQPWPFPSSLMLGFIAHATTTQVHCRDEELEDARWFSRDEIASGKPMVPPNVSISFRLIEHWFDAAGGRRLRDVNGVATWTSSR